MKPLRVEVTRGRLVESVHQVSVAVVEPSGRLVAWAGDPDLVTFWRSAAKPFQAMPLIQDGAVDRFGLTDQELALACASHSSEPMHLDLVERFLAKVGIEESALACGPHPPLSPTVADRVIRDGITLTPRWSNCSGKHTGMLTLAKHHGWPLAGYERAGHPVQDRVLTEVERWTSLDRRVLIQEIDGCTAVCFGLSLRAMAISYARLGVSTEPAARRIVTAMTSHPELVAGTGRLCTDLMRAWPGGTLAKVGAEGIYCGSIPERGLGLALKVLDGDSRSAAVALLAVVRALVPDRPELDHPTLAPHRELKVDTTRGEEVGRIRAAGELAFV